MYFSRPSRVIAAIIAIFSLLFTQLALAAYACPDLDVAKSVAMATDGAKVPGCANMDMKMDSPGLCHSHCEAGDQTADTPQVPLVQPFVAAELTVVLSVAESVSQCDTLQPEGVLLKRSTAPPLAIRNCCFRI
ncbi:hypothetical protein [Massilia sp. TWR1-2-2]|uniref:hypothetical protein n=1 Tax=Massilia sp. TWR1-2-2 TaxID=2804584 RepID=UPI003CF15173